MEATLLGSHRSNPSLLSTKPLKIPDGHVARDLRFYHPLCAKAHRTLKMKLVNSSRSHFVLPNRWFQSRARREWSSNSSDQLRSDYINVKPSSSESLNLEAVPSSSDDGADISDYNVVNNIETSHIRPKYFRNRFLNFVRLSSVLNNAAESFFKSEIRRRLFVTAVLLVISRIGYFIPLPGFDRRLIPQDYLSFASGSVDDLGDFSAELKLSFFQLGISPQIIASIIMQVLCHVVPSLVKLRKEGLDVHEEDEGEVSEEFVWCKAKALELAMEGIWPVGYSNFSEKMETLVAQMEKVAEKILIVFREIYQEKTGRCEKEKMEGEDGNGWACYVYKHGGNVSAEKWRSCLRYDVMKMLIGGMDYSHTLCLHICDGSSEFHVYSKKGWVSFCPHKHALVVTVGDQTQALSGGQLKHVMGRPIYRGEKEEFISMAFLYSPSTTNSRLVDPQKPNTISLSQQAIAAILFTLLYQILVYVYYKF